MRHGDDPEGKNEIVINALVSPSMSENMILCYNDLVRLKVLLPQFPGLLNSSQSRAVCTEATDGKSTSVPFGSLAFMPQATDERSPSVSFGIAR